MSDHVQAHYFALRRTNTSTGRVQWLHALITSQFGDRLIENEFYPKKKVYEKTTWADGDEPTWFKTQGQAKLRLRTRAVKLDKPATWIRWDVVEVQLIERTKIVHTTIEDAITKLALIGDGA